MNLHTRTSLGGSAPRTVGDSDSPELSPRRADAEFTLGLDDEWEDIPTAHLDGLSFEEPTSGIEASVRESDSHVSGDIPLEKRAQISAPPQQQALASAAAATMPRDISTGTLLCDRYVLGRLLGAGGSSLIYQAEDRARIGAQDFGSRIAIKLLRPEMRNNLHALTRLRREFRQMQRLSHRGIARVFDLANDEDIWFMTMELIEGATINQWLKGPAHPIAGLKVINACCEALHHAHEAGVVHGDLKPSNVLVLPDGGVKLVDFGSAAERDAVTGTIDKERSFAATPPYASPQVLAGDIADPRDDVFSLACLTYAVLTHGEHPFARKSSTEAQRLQMRPTYAKSIPPRQFDAIVRALSWDREQRPVNVREFLHALLASDLRRDARESPSVTVDAPSKPIAAPASAAATRSPAPSRVTHATPQAEEPRAAQPAELTRLKAAAAAAEAHVEKIEAPAARAEATPHKPDPLERFKGYVAGPMAPDAEDDLARPGAMPSADASGSAMPKKKWTWPWQRSALFGVLIATALAIAASRVDLHTEPIRHATALPTPAAAAAMPAAPARAEAKIAMSASAAPPHIEEKKTSAIALEDRATFAPAEVSFTTRTLQIGANQTVAALTVKRLNSARGRAKVLWTIEGGTAQRGVHYELPQPHVIEFLDGQDVRTLFIPLTPEKDAENARHSKTFTVKLQRATGGPSLGQIKQVYVTIVGDVAIDRFAATPESG